MSYGYGFESRYRHLIKLSNFKIKLMEIFFILFISFIIFVIGFFGLFLVRKNLIIILMSIEIMLLSINLNFLIFSFLLDDLIGESFALLILTVAAAEAAIGLAILIVYYRLRGVISLDYISSLKG